jgi:two-component system, sensor histidine kinase
LSVSAMMVDGRRHAVGILRDITEERQAANALRESESRYRTLANLGTALIWTCGVDKQCDYFNRPWLDFTGRKPEQEFGVGWLEGVHPEDAAQCFETFAQAFDRREPFSMIYRLRRCDGEYRWVQDNGTPRYDSQGEFLGYIGHCLDITDQKEAERSLLVFKTAVEQSLDGIAIADLDGTARFVNRAWAKMHGCSIEESIGQPLSVFHTKQQLETEVTPFVERLLKIGDSEGVIGHVRKDGTTFPAQISCNLLVDADRKPFGLLGIARDISDSKRAEEALRHSQTMLLCVLNLVPQSIFWKDRNSVFLGCNEVFAKRAGLRAAEVVGKTDFDLPWTREESEGYRAHDQEVMASQTPRIHILEQQHQSDGTFIWLDTTKIPLVDAEGNCYGILGVYDDVTERKRMEDELRIAKDTAESATQMKSQFLASMSHEIRTPMTAILGYARLLTESTACCSNCPHFDACQQRNLSHEAVNAIRRNGEHLLALINDILDLSKIEAKKLQIERMPYSLPRLIDEAASLMQPLAAVKHLKLETELIEPFPEIAVIDPLRVRQILVNLVGNAVKFTERGVVRLTMRWLADAAPQQLQFQVIDTGIGMSQAQIAKLFLPFAQVGCQANRGLVGTGLGLCITKVLAEAMGGGIEVVSKPGSGSTFTVAIAAAPSQDEDAAPQKPASGVASQTAGQSSPRDRIALNGRILLVEDGMDNQRLISLLLRRVGADVTIVSNGQAAIDAILAANQSGKPFDVVLMDMQMPVLDGYEATRRLRAMKYAGPIIALTANAMSQDRQECLDAGCNDYLSKPIDHRALMETIAKYMSTTSQTDLRD